MSAPYRVMEQEAIEAWTNENQTKKIDLETYDGMQEIYIEGNVQYDIGTAVATAAARGAFGAAKEITLKGGGKDTIWQLNSHEIKWLMHYWMRNLPKETAPAVTQTSDLTAKFSGTLPLMIPEGEYKKVELYIKSGDVDVDVIDEAATSVTTLDQYDFFFGVKYSAKIGERFYTAHSEEVASASTEFTFSPPVGYRLLGAIVFTFDNQAEPALADELEDNLDSFILKHKGSELYNQRSELALAQTADILNVDADSLLKADGSGLAFVYLIPCDRRTTSVNTKLKVKTNANAATTDTINVLWLLSTPVKAAQAEA